MSISGSNDIRYIIDKLKELEVRLGGRKNDKQRFNKKADEFERAKLVILENIHEARGKMNELKKKESMNNFRKVDVAMLRMKIREKLIELRGQLKKIDKIVKAQNKSKKMTSIDKKKRADLANKFYEIVEDIQAEYDGKPIERIRRPGQGEKFKQDQKYLYNDLGKFSSHSKNRRENRSDTIDDNERAALEDWKMRDEQIEDKLGDINILLDEINQQAQEQQDAIRVRNELMNQADKEVEKVSAALTTENERLKELVKKYRAPDKCCLDITLILMILGLIGVIVSMVRGNGT